MKTSAFEQWCDRLQLPTATRDFLLRLRSSPPVRRVQGRLLNVCGTYASRKMGVTHPGRYQRDERGKWRCPPGEAAAESLGLSYRVRSSEELHPGYIRNLIFLEEYFNESILSYFYCITSCLLAHCPFGRFFLAFLPLYSDGNDTRLSHPR